MRSSRARTSSEILQLATVSLNHYLTMRDEFSRQTIETLAKRVGVRCSNRACRKLTTGPHVDPGRIVNIGVAAHITAASSGGPRYDPTLTSEQRQSPDNGIWLCQSCAKLVDSDTGRYTAEVLLAWKRFSEEAAFSEVEGRAIQSEPDNAAELTIAYREHDIRTERHDYKLIVSVRNLGTEPLSDYHVDVEVPRPLIERPETHVKLVAARSTADVCLIRATYDPRLEVYPGDSKDVLVISYRVDHNLFWNRGDLFERAVRATLYRKGFNPVSIEKAVGDLQCF